MTYTVEPVDREYLPAGRDWMFLEHPDGSATFVIARDAGPVELSAEILSCIVPAATEAVGLRVVVAS